MARFVDHVLALLPCEQPYMTAAGMGCDVVGDPVAGQAAPPAAEVAAFRARAGVGGQVGQGGKAAPGAADAGKSLAEQPDGVFLATGPGDPRPLTPAIETIRTLVEQKPVFGICLGQQLLGLALGCKIFKLKFGHRGANQPVKNLATGRVEITSQNHGFAIDPESLEAAGARATHVNLND